MESPAPAAAAAGIAAKAPDANASLFGNGCAEDGELIDMLLMKDDGFDGMLGGRADGEVPAYGEDLNFSDLLDFGGNFGAGEEGADPKPPPPGAGLGDSPNMSSSLQYAPPDFNDTSPLGPQRLGEGSRAGGPRAKLHFREFETPVPASYYRSQSFSVRSSAHASPPQHPGAAEDYLQSSPPRPTRSLSCPESHGSAQDSIFVYDEAAAPNHHHHRHHPYAYYTPHGGPHAPPVRQYGKALYGENLIHKGTVISPDEAKAHKRKKQAQRKPLAAGPHSHGQGSSSQGSKAKKPAGPTRQRSSQYRGVTKHRRSGRWEAHIWVRETGKQVYLGGYELEEHAAEAYDVAALKCKGHKVKTNFETSKYGELLQYMDTITLDELVMAVRRQSQGFARGSSKFRGVTRHPNGRWEARIGMPGSKHIYLGLYNDEAEAAKAYDKALVKLRGPAAATNFAMSEYHEELKEYHKAQQKKILSSVAASAEAKAEEEVVKKEAGAADAQAGKDVSLSKTIVDHATACL
ncbi:AP2-like ethylene-responsive transcription factor [Chloropicon roscoffensis]|uniref:AP2-like ethylene-responsive transcription factor n=1 Tax=Chloropicon roscoffensis TaxID=1461544 RepID=A0AAX4P7D1_9CHLO